MALSSALVLNATAPSITLSSGDGQLATNQDLVLNASAPTISLSSGQGEIVESNDSVVLTFEGVEVVSLPLILNGTSPSIAISGNSGSIETNDPLTLQGASPTIQLNSGNGQLVTTSAGVVTLTLNGVSVVPLVPEIVSVTPVRASESFTIEIDAKYDLTSAGSVTATFNSVSLTNMSVIDATHVSFDAPDDGLELGSDYDLAITIDGETSQNSQQTFLPPTGFSYVTLTANPSTPPLDTYAGSGSSAIGTDDQVVWQTVNAEGYTVSVTSEGEFRILNSASDADGITQVVFYYQDAQDGLSKSGTVTLTAYTGTDPLVLNGATSPSITLAGNAGSILTGNLLNLDASNAPSIQVSGSTGSIYTNEALSLDASSTPSVQVSGSTGQIVIGEDLVLNASSTPSIEISGSTGSIDTLALLSLDSGVTPQINFSGSTAQLSTGGDLTLTSTAPGIEITTGQGTIQTDAIEILNGTAPQVNISGSTGQLAQFNVLRLYGTAPHIELGSTVGELVLEAELILNGTAPSIEIRSGSGTIQEGEFLPDRLDINPRNLKTSSHNMHITRNHNNKVSIKIEHEGEPLDLRAFNIKFELYGLRDRPIDTDDYPDAITLGENNELIIDVGMLTTIRGEDETVMVGYGTAYQNGVVLWSKGFRDAQVKAIILE